MSVFSLPYFLVPSQVKSRIFSPYKSHPIRASINLGLDCHWPWPQGWCCIDLSSSRRFLPHTVPTVPILLLTFNLRYNLHLSSSYTSSCVSSFRIFLSQFLTRLSLVASYDTSSTRCDAFIVILGPSQLLSSGIATPAHRSILARSNYHSINSNTFY